MQLAGLYCPEKLKQRYVGFRCRPYQSAALTAPVHVQRLAGQFGGSWLQFSSHQVSVAPAPGTAWHVLAGPGGGGGGGDGPGGGEGGGGGPGGVGPGHGPGGPGGAGLGPSGSGMVPLQRAEPGKTELQIACATSSGLALQVEAGALKSSQKKPDLPGPSELLTMSARSALWATSTHGTAASTCVRSAARHASTAATEQQPCDPPPSSSSSPHSSTR